MPTEAENPYRSPQYSDTPLIVEPFHEELGALIGEYRVSRIVVGASLVLFTVTTFICLFVLIIMIIVKRLGGHGNPLAELGFCFCLELGSGLFTLAALRTRFSVFELGIISTNAIKTTYFRYAEICAMHVSAAPKAHFGKSINPLRSHLVIATGSPKQKRYYLCPFLISGQGLFETAISAWLKVTGRE